MIIYLYLRTSARETSSRLAGPGPQWVVASRRIVHSLVFEGKILTGMKLLHEFLALYVSELTICTSHPYARSTQNLLSDSLIYLN